jgi:hypothetical protein
MKFGKSAVVGLMLATVALSGCTRALQAEYRPGLEVPKTATVDTLGIARFVDDRAWISGDDSKSASFIAQQGTWKFGISPDGKTYQPVTDFIQDIAVAEFNSAGVIATALKDKAPTNAAQMAELARKAGTTHVLGGRILAFEFVNETGVWTVDSRRAVSLALTLASAARAPVFENKLLTENDRENEGMAVMHSTNVDKLVNGVFKKVLTQMVLQVSQTLVLDVRSVTVTTEDGTQLAFAPGEGGELRFVGVADRSNDRQAAL